MYKLQEIIKAALVDIKKTFKGTEEEFNALLKEKSVDILLGASTIFLESLTDFYSDKRISEIQDAVSKFQEKQKDFYEEGLKLFLMFIDLQVSVNSDMTSQFEVDKFPEDDKLKFMQLLQLHIRACQIGNEIFTLLQSGYADAALARWRTLHETCVVFIILFDNDVSLSRMFYEYQKIETLKRATTFQIHNETLKWRPIEQNNINSLKQSKANLILKYGKEFTEEYGWTINLLKKGQRNFAELEKLSGLSYLRPFYQWANNGVHSGPAGIFSRIGFKDNLWKITREVLAGPTHFGMVDPMQFTTYSLIEIIKRLLGLKKSLENGLLLHVLENLHKLILESMIEGREKLPK